MSQTSQTASGDPKICLDAVNEMKYWDRLKLVYSNRQFRIMFGKRLPQLCIEFDM